MIFPCVETMEEWRLNEVGKLKQSLDSDCIGNKKSKMIIIKKRFSPLKQTWTSARSPHWLHDSKTSHLPCYKPNYFKKHLLEAILKITKIQPFPKLESYFGRSGL